MIEKLVIMSYIAVVIVLVAECAVGAEYGEASYYADKFQGRPTASSEPFDQQKMTAAHRELPFQTKVMVTHLENDLSVVVRVNDRGPFVPGRIIDLSRAAAEVIDIVREGHAPVMIEVIKGF